MECSKSAPHRLGILITTVSPRQVDQAIDILGHKRTSLRFTLRALCLRHYMRIYAVVCMRIQRPPAACRATDPDGLGATGRHIAGNTALAVQLHMNMQPKCRQRGAGVGDGGFKAPDAAGWGLLICTPRRPPTSWRAVPLRPMHHKHC